MICQEMERAQKKRKIERILEELRLLFMVCENADLGEEKQ